MREYSIRLYGAQILTYFLQYYSIFLNSLQSFIFICDSTAIFFSVPLHLEPFWGVLMAMSRITFGKIREYVFITLAWLA